MSIRFRVDGRDAEVPDDGASLLEALRDRLGLRSPKDGCSPQGQCGCCTVWVDGAPRVACVTPVRRVAGREVTTLDGLPADQRDAWAAAFTDCGASQCGFCTPGIIMRLAAAKQRPEEALLAHLCRCTGWRTILEAVDHVGAPSPSGRDLAAAARRAELEGGVPQAVGPEVALGRGRFADDSAPLDALVAVPDPAGGWAVGETLIEARGKAAKVQGRRTSIDPRPPVPVPPGDWDLTLQTTWVEPAYLEPDASWCEPGGEPYTPLANGGAFGGKAASMAPGAARELADAYRRPVRVLLSREDVVRRGPKRPPMAAGVRADGTGRIHAVRTPGIVEAIQTVCMPNRLDEGIQAVRMPDRTEEGVQAVCLFEVEEVDVPGPPTSAAIRAAGWAEAAVLHAVLAAFGGESPRNRHEKAAGLAEGGVTVVAPNGARARADIDPTGRVHISVACGDPLDEIVLRSYCIGAAHMALGWVRSEGIYVDDEGVPHDLTIRSFGILRAKDTPPVEVTIEPSDGPPVNGSDAVFAAVAAVAWLADGLPPVWPTKGAQPA